MVMVDILYVFQNTLYWCAHAHTHRYIYKCEIFCSNVFLGSSFLLDVLNRYL